MKESDVIKDLTKKINNSSSYYIEGTLEIVNNEDIYTYDVEVSYAKKDNYKVRLVNNVNNHEQIILRNKEGVYVVTPRINKSFKFQSDWPYNNSQVYLLSPLLEDITSDDNRVFEEVKDGYKLTVAANYPNNPKLVKQEILLDKNSNIKSVTVIDKDGNKQISMNYKKIDLNSKFKNSYFDLKEIIDVKEETDKKEIPPVMLLKSDGGVLYDTTELATLYSRIKRFKASKYFYLTDVRQELHFVEAFRAAYKTGIVPKDISLEWFGFGTLNGPDGKPFKTRDGGIMSLRELISIVKTETRKVIKDNIKEEDKDDLAEVLAIAAIKYADLLPNRTSDYVFDPIKFSDINGKTGPYILYSTVRMKSLLSKSNLKYNKYYKYNSTNDYIMYLQ